MLSHGEQVSGPIPASQIKTGPVETRMETLSEAIHWLRVTGSPAGWQP